MLPFGEWMPDQPALENPGAMTALNVVPNESGYLPFSDFDRRIPAITGGAKGAFSAHDLAGTVYNFCGDRTKLYRLNAGGTAWDDVSRTVGGAYTLAADGWWSFSQFGNYVMADNGVDAAQTFIMGTDTNFHALAGSPPVAQFNAVLRGFALKAKVAGQFNRVQWCAIENPADWVPSAATMADYQDLPDGGIIQGIVGGEYGIVLQENAITRMAFEGPPNIMRFDKLANDLGCYAARSVAALNDKIFFLTSEGFYMVQGGSAAPIGTGKVDRWFFDRMNTEMFNYMSATVDPVRKVYMLGFSSGVSSAYNDSIMIYHWPTAKWATAAVNHELLFRAIPQAGYTLDGLDAVSSSIDLLTSSLDSSIWTGLGKIYELAGFDSLNRFGFFSGANLAATIETGESQPVPGRKAMVRGVRPLVDGTNINLRVTHGWRDRLQDPVQYGSPVTVNSNGWAPLRRNARYHRISVTTNAGDVWSQAVGIDQIDASGMSR